MNRILIFFVALIAFSACQQKPVEEKPVEQKPRQCPTCNGTGSITHSEKIPLKCEITGCQITNTGLFNPDYFSDVTIENKGDEDGTFKVFTDFIFKAIGTHTVSDELFVKAHSQATKRLHYDADHLVDATQCRVEAPLVIHSTKDICPTCGGSGMTK